MKNNKKKTEPMYHCQQSENQAHCAGKAGLKEENKD